MGGPKGKRKVTNHSRSWERQFVGHSRKPELVDVTVERLGATDKAIHVTEGLKDKEGKLIKHWLPLSQIEVENVDQNGLLIKVTMPRWLFEEKNLTSDA